MRTSRSYSLNNFPLYPTSMLTTVLMLHIMSLVHTYHTTGSLSLLSTFLQIPLKPIPPLVTKNLIPFAEPFFFFLIPQKSEIMQ